MSFDLERWIRDQPSYPQWFREQDRKRRERLMMARASIWMLLGVTCAAWLAALMGWL